MAQYWIEQRIRGAIINIASMGSYRPLSGGWAYSAAKAAVINQTVAHARELAPHGIRVNALAPGFFLGKQNRRLLMAEDGTPTARGQAVLAHTPLGRFGDPDELIAAAVFLANGRWLAPATTSKEGSHERVPQPSRCPQAGRTRRGRRCLSSLGAGAASLLSPAQAYAQAAPGSLLRTVLDRGKLIVGTGSTNAPWHFEDEKGQLVGMDITMARILAKGLFDDENKVEFVLQDPAARIPNITTGKVDIVIQFMTVTPARAQLVNFTRPYYVEGVALLTRPKGESRPSSALLAGGANTKVSILQNVDAEQLVHAGAAAGAGDAARHPGQRHPGARIRARRRRGGRPLDGALAGQAQTRTATSTAARSWYHACSIGAPCARAIRTG